MKTRYRLAVGVLAMSLAMAGCSTSGQGSDPNNPDQLEVFTWWSSGSDEAGLEALVGVYEDQYPEIEFINASVAGDAGTTARAALSARLTAENPPDTFQAHAGAELIDYIEAGRLQDLSAFYAETGLTDAFPPSLIERLTVDQKIYSVPSNVRRANVLWANTRVLESAGIDSTSAPLDIDAWILDLQRLRGSGLDSPLALGAGSSQVQLFENCLLADLGPDGYNNLWAGYLKWDGPGIRQAVDHYFELLEYVDAGFASEDPADAVRRVIAGTAAYVVAGDWAESEFSGADLRYGDDFTAMPTPGTAGAFDFLADSFTLPVGAPHEDAARNWLRTVGSPAGQEALSLAMGSIPARTDVLTDGYSTYQLTAIESFGRDEIVGSLAFGAAARASWSAELAAAITKFGRDRHPEALVTALLHAAKNACEAGAGPSGLSLCEPET